MDLKTVLMEAAEGESGRDDWSPVCKHQIKPGYGQLTWDGSSEANSQDHHLRHPSHEGTETGNVSLFSLQPAELTNIPN